MMLSIPKGGVLILKFGVDEIVALFESTPPRS